MHTFDWLDSNYVANQVNLRIYEEYIYTQSQVGTLTLAASSSLYPLEITNQWLEQEDEMSSIGQSIVMALTVTVNKFASSNLQAVPHRKLPESTPNSTIPASRRGLLLSSLAAISSSFPDSKTLLLQKYLKKSEENKEKNDKERLESYYKRNYKDYFELVEGTLKAKQQDQLSDTEKAIIDWLKSNQ